MLENFKRKKDDAKRISLLADAAVEWWAKKISGEEPHDNGSNDFTSFAACRMADMGRKKITEKHRQPGRQLHNKRHNNLPIAVRLTN